MKALLLLAGLLGMSGCSARYAVLTVPAVSMTEPSVDASAASATSAGRVESKYCPGDESLTSKDNNVGLIDEAVMRAQKQSGADYLTDVTVYRDGSCVVVEGVAMKRPQTG